MILSDKDPFSAKSWREFLNHAEYLKRHNLGINDVKEALDNQKREFKRQVDDNRAAGGSAPKCPYCGFTLRLLAVNNTSATRTGDDSRSVWNCVKCHYEKFSTQSVKEEMQILLNKKKQEA